MRRKLLRWLNRYIQLGVVVFFVTLCLCILLTQHITFSNPDTMVGTMAARGVPFHGPLDKLMAVHDKNGSSSFHEPLSTGQTSSLLAGNPRPYPVYITVGVPTLKRPKGEYFFNTLSSLLQQSSGAQHKNMTVVVMLADRDSHFNAAILEKIKKKHALELEEGVVLVISAPDSDLVFQAKDMKRTFNDSLERVRWRSKQNLDYASLMAFSSNLSTYYLQVEDDVMAAPNYIQHIQSFIKANEHRQWAGLEVCPHGFIGKLFRCNDLLKLVTLLRTFYLEMPCDFLISHFYNLMLQKKVIRRKGNLFYHQGKYSSLFNVTRKTDKITFSKPLAVLKIRQNHVNPQATLHTSMRVFTDYRLANAYDLKSSKFFWAKDLREGDELTVMFTTPQAVKKIAIETGFIGQKMISRDEVKNATVELGKKGYVGHQGKKALCTETSPLGDFQNGRFEMTLNPVARDVKCFNIVIRQAQQEWLAIREIAVYV